MNTNARRAVAANVIDVNWRFAPTKRAARPVGWPFAVFYTGPQSAPRRAKP